MRPTTVPADNPPANTELGRRVYNSLQRLGYRQHSNVLCESNGATVTLKGELPSYYLMQLAQTIAMKVPGVRKVVNQINVRETPSKPR